MAITIKKLKLEKPTAVYDITVPETETFFANDIAVHNCSEIFLSSQKDESFVCNLSSLNLENWDEIVETDAVETLVYFLDAVMTEFINKTENMAHMSAPRNFAIRQRALGVGVLGWHSYLQKNNVAFESIEAQARNIEIWKKIRERADDATSQLAKLFGEPDLLHGYGRRNVTTLAIAPTTSCVTPETEFLDGDGEPIDYWEFCDRGGVSLNELLMLDVEFEDGSKIKVPWNSIIVLDDGSEVKAIDYLTDAPTT